LASLLGGESRVPVTELPVRNIGIQSQLLALLQIDLSMIIAVGGEGLFLKVICPMAEALQKNLTVMMRQGKGRGYHYIPLLNLIMAPLGKI